MDKKKMLILIVDDNQINRKILGAILSSDYDSVEAENGQAAYDVLEQMPDVAAILLDIVMPVMDGYTFLKKLPETRFANLPVLVLTGSADEDSEQRVLDQGAWDFVPKPYSPKVLLSRLKNAIARSQLYLLEQLKYNSEHDAQTDLLNKSKYFDETRRLLDRYPDEQFAIICFNINGLRALNSFWGEEEGHSFIRYAADLLRRMAGDSEKCNYGRIDPNFFSLCEPYDPNTVQRQMEFMNREIAEYNRDYLLEAFFGVYIIDDWALGVDVMYARAELAAEACRREFVRLCYYKPEMSENIQKEQQIIRVMQQALDEEQFVVYLQPKYNLKNETPYGAEALIRWQHPTWGLVSPGLFIPVFERNGFIGKVDFYVWERICRLLRKWIDEGQDPAPVSVNVSRVNLYNPNLAQNIINLVDKYDIPHRLLNLEITESAYMENPEVMQKTVKTLREKGFIIMMDDFGSGYSSLNTLKDIHMDILKIDMKFLSYDEENSRGARILASVIQMARWLEMPVIVEGVETARQRDFLESVGCEYVQGYYYARPMPVEDYEELVRDVRQVPARDMPENIARLAETLWSEDPKIELLFKSISQPMVILEFDGEDFHALRANRKYNMEFGYREDVLGKTTANLHHMEPYMMQKIRDAFISAVDSKGATGCDYSRTEADGENKWFHVDIQYWGSNGTASILFAMFEDITNQKKYEELQQLLREHDETIERRSILVMEDSLLSREAIRRTFEPDYNILEAENGQEGIELMEKNEDDDIALILLDLIMPVMDGTEFLKKKNQNPKWKDIPVIVISSRTDDTDQLEMLSLGVNDYVTKPFVPETLRRRVENVLEYQDRFSLLMEEYRRAAR